ncbi:MAG: hypothetical protein FWG05_02235 [Kiritimatiellaeota bacterium]|nr:hypothetical protein [Kiritimatiellota bacterium]
MKKEILLAMLCSSCAKTDINDNSAKDPMRERVDKLLAEIAAQPEPVLDKIWSAMCYEMMAPPERAEYVCPICGAKTIHVKDAAETVAWTLENHRYFLEEVVKFGLDASLDERAFCETCRKESGLENGSLDVYLDVRMNGKIAHTLLEENDWDKLTAFLEGTNVWKNMDGEYPLKPELPRIRKLLGIDD